MDSDLTNLKKLVAIDGVREGFGQSRCDQGQKRSEVQFLLSLKCLLAI